MTSIQFFYPTPFHPLYGGRFKVHSLTCGSPETARVYVDYHDGIHLQVLQRSGPGEHDVGRDCVSRMRESSQAASFDGPGFAAAAREFIPLLRQHIFKEIIILFRMAENVMSQTDDAEVFDNFQNVEARRGLTGLHDRY